MGTHGYLRLFWGPWGPAISGSLLGMIPEVTVLLHAMFHKRFINHTRAVWITAKKCMMFFWNGIVFIVEYLGIYIYMWISWCEKMWFNMIYLAFPWGKDTKRRGSHGSRNMEKTPSWTSIMVTLLWQRQRLVDNDSWMWKKCLSCLLVRKPSLTI